MTQDKLSPKYSGRFNAITHAQLEAVWSVHSTLEDKLEALRKFVKKQPYYDDCSVVSVHAT